MVSHMPDLPRKVLHQFPQYMYAELTSIQSPGKACVDSSKNTEEARGGGNSTE